ncbi:MAG: hypothetical protein L0H40_07365 [Micrococcaceae bacterium]|nr:hypothetical protein [Micrococcaceae bacterium]
MVTEEPVCNGNTETWKQLFSNDSILLWHGSSFAPKRAHVKAFLAADGPMKTVRFGSRRRTRRWLRLVAENGRIPTGPPGDAAN